MPSRQVTDPSASRSPPRFLHGIRKHNRSCGEFEARFTTFSITYLTCGARRGSYIYRLVLVYPGSVYPSTSHPARSPSCQLRKRMFPVWDSMGIPVSAHQFLSLSLLWGRSLLTQRSLRGACIFPVSSSNVIISNPLPQKFFIGFAGWYHPIERVTTSAPDNCSCIA